MAVSVPPGAAPPSDPPDAPEPAAQATLVTLIAAVLSSAVRAGVELRSLVERASGRAHEDGADAVPPVVDAAFDLTLRATAVAADVATRTTRLVRPVALLALRPPIVGPRFWPETVLARMVDRGRNVRATADRQSARMASDLVNTVVNEVLDRIDLTQLVIDRVKLNQIVDAVDIDAIVAQVDLVAIVDRIPFNRVIAQIDLNSAAAGIDVNAIAARLDIDAVLDRVDLAGIANQVINEINLPEIIRESSGAMASETVLSMRSRGIEADETINRIVDRILLRRRARNTVALQPPGDHEDPAPPNGVEGR